MVGRLLASMAGVIGALWLGVAGGGAVYWYDRRAPHSPVFTVPALFFHFHFGLPESLKAQLAELEAGEAAAAERARAVEARQARVGAEAEARDRAAEVQIRWRTRTILKEIPIAISPVADRAFPLSVGFVRLHDAAARGVDLSDVPVPAGGADDAASPVAPSDLAGVIVGNYGTCRADQQRLADLQGWVRREGSTN